MSTFFSLHQKDAKNVLREVEKHHGIIERFSVDSYSFSHPSFQEYFAARHFLAKRKEMEIVRAHYEDDNWSSVIEFIAALHNDATELLEFLMHKSKMENLKNYPAMARRTKRLWLLYRCLRSGAIVDNTSLKKILSHLVDSQIEMTEIFKNGGVFPVAVLMRDGVRHTYFFFRKRPTLHAALQPLRRFANEILNSPLNRYAEIVLDRSKAIESQGSSTFTLEKEALLLNLIIPLAIIKPQEVEQHLIRIKTRGGAKGIGRIVDESLNVLRENFLPC